MKPYLVVSIIGFIFAIIFTLIQPHIASLLLSKELSSDRKVEEILNIKNETVSPSSEVIFNNHSLSYAPDFSYLNQLSYLTENYQLSNTRVLGVNDDKWIEVDISDQRLTAWEKDHQIYSYLISSGKWAPTPTGNYRVWIKLASTTMKGGSKALGTYYYLANVPCTMYFYKGYGIHGAYWHNNFGRPMSHGCVNMRPSESCTIFNWAEVGTKVNVHI